MVIALAALLALPADAREDDAPSSYAPVEITEPFAQVVARMKREKPDIQKRQAALLQQRYDLANRPAQGVTMTNGKPVQAGVRVKLPRGVSWEELARMSPSEIREKKLFPAGFLPLPHPNHPEGGMLFPRFHIDEIKQPVEFFSLVTGVPLEAQEKSDLVAFLRAL
jgi:cytochrome c peroxidase